MLTSPAAVCMPDGKRRRRHSQNHARRHWYAIYRSLRFRRRFGFLGGCELACESCSLCA
jgi:hypothetical protein